MLTINNLQVTFGSTKALDIKTPIHIAHGDRIGIIGSNGAGKSTLLKTLLGLIPYEGTVTSSVQPHDIAVHLQENNYINTVSVKLLLETFLNTKIKANKKLQELITYFDFEKCLPKKFKQLSGGQQQRLTIIIVLMEDAQLTFFDEVTSGLDFETRQQLMQQINQWYQDKEATVCLVSHYYDELDVLVNKLLLLEQGQVVAFGDKLSLFQKYCGYSTIIVDNTPENRHVLSTFPQLAAPNHLCAFSCRNSQEEQQVITTCLEQNINFKRSNNDIEIMSINAKKQEGFSHEEK